MSEKSKSELFLEALKILLWPGIVIIAALWFGSDLKEMLKNRSWKIGIVEMGEKIETLEGSVQEQLIVQKDYLSKINKKATNADSVRMLTEEAILAIENAQQGVKREIQNIQNAVPDAVQPQQTSNSDESSGSLTAQQWEKTGFNFIVDRDVEQAIEAFTEAEKKRPDFHNVSEIRRLLVNKKENLNDVDSDGWKPVYEKILKDFSWGMPSGIRPKMKAYLDSSR